MFCMSQKILILLPPALLEKIDYLAQVESRTRSDLVREALRRYIAVAEANTPVQLPINFAPVHTYPITTIK